MHPDFRAHIETLEPKVEQLLGMTPVTYSSLPKVLPKRAIYLFSEDATHLYVGRTNRLRERLRGHCIPSATHFTATFAFRMARVQTGREKATYTKEGSRASLVNDAVFSPAFVEARSRVGRMNLRFVEETDPVCQALLEIYVATVLKTPYNDFDNH